jgi:hypothetical protein
VSGVSITRDSLRVMAFIPDDLASLPAEADPGADAQADWAAWVGISCTAVGERSALVLVSIAVTALAGQPGGAAGGGGGLVALARAKHPELGGDVEEFTTSDGSAAVTLRGLVTRAVHGRDITTGQVQALVVYPAPGALGVVSGICFHPDDLKRAADIVAGIATRMTVTGVTAAA